MRPWPRRPQREGNPVGRKRRARQRADAQPERDRQAGGGQRERAKKINSGRASPHANQRQHRQYMGCVDDGGRARGSEGGREDDQKNTGQQTPEIRLKDG